MVEKIVITGATGYIGSALTKELVDDGYSLVLLSRDKNKIDEKYKNYYLEPQYSSTKFWEQIFQNSDTVIHLASQTSTYEANKNPEWDWSQNVAPILSMLETGKKIGKKVNILFASTATIVGINEAKEINEEMQDKPATIYDLHKWSAEQYLKYYTRLGYAGGCSLRLSNVYGPGQVNTPKDRGILNMMAGRAIRGEKITIYGSGKYIRDYVYISDVISAFHIALKKIQSFQGDHFLIGSQKGTTIKEALELTASLTEKETGEKVEVIHVDEPVGLSPIEFRNYISTSQKFYNRTGWTANVGLEEGILKTIQSMKKVYC